jgi:TonB family protein
MPPTAKENETLSARPETAQRPASTTTSPSDMAVKQQPVALEVPVTVNGARTVEGSDKREPFSETTKTVLVFGNGAVIRLTSSVAPGQLLFLTNEKTKKEVVCQVVKSKNYRNVSGYVELEFTESVVGFWGMRFPSDRLGGGAQPEASAPAAVSSFLASGSPAIPQPVAPNAAASPANGTPSTLAAKPVVPISVVKDAEPKLAEAKLSIPTAPKLAEPVAQKSTAPIAPLSSTLSATFDPEAPLYPSSTTPLPPVVPVVPVAPASATPQFSVNPAPAKPVAPESALFDSPRASEAQASILEPAKSPAATGSVSNLLSLFEVKSASPAVVPPPPAPPSAAPETEALKQHTARLQEQLSNMMFSGAAAAPAPATVQIPHAPPVAIKKEPAQSPAKVLETSQIRTPEPAPVEPAKLEPRPAKSLLADEQLKIPAWLEPLARNAVPSSTQELIEREKAKRLAEQPKDEQTAAESLTEEYVPELPPPTYDEELPVDEEQGTEEDESGSSSKGILIGAIAASVLLAGGGWWYMQRQSGGVHASPVSASNVQASVASLPAASSPSQPQGNALQQTNPPAQSNPAVLTNTSGQSNPAALTNTSVQSNSGPAALSAVRAGASAETARNSQPSSNPANAGPRATTLASAQPVAEQPKKLILGAVHLAKPKVSPNRSAQNGAEPDAGIALNNDAQPESSAEALNAGLAGGSKQPSAPAAPLPVGGDVKQAKLIFSVPPVYPALAKSQHVSGNVLIDALIDANGHVTTMKVVSGPTLLHQAAMDALRQWKYQPASLDGKFVPMHLAVTIQFRLQ